MSGQTQPETALQSLAEKLRTDAIAIFGDGQAERDIIEWFYAALLAAAQSAPAGEQPAPYGWVAAGQFFTGRESAVNAAGKTPCVEVYSRPQVLAELARSAVRQAAAEELARQLRQTCDELRALKSAPAGEREPVAYVLTRDGEVCYEADDGIVISNTPGDETGLYKWQPVYFGAAWQRTQAAVVPDGYVLVPVEPTAEMMMHESSCQHHAADDMSCPVRRTRRNIWARMLAAAPAQPAAQETRQTCNGVGIVGHSELCPECNGSTQSAPQQNDEVRRLREALDCDRAYRNGLQAGYSFGASGDEDGYQRSMAAYGREILAASSGQEVES